MISAILSDALSRGTYRIPQYNLPLSLLQIDYWCQSVQHLFNDCSPLTLFLYCCKTNSIYIRGMLQKLCTTMQYKYHPILLVILVINLMQHKPCTFFLPFPKNLALLFWTFLYLLLSSLDHITTVQVVNAFSVFS